MYNMCVYRCIVIDLLHKNKDASRIILLSINCTSHLLEGCHRLIQELIRR